MADSDASGRAQAGTPPPPGSEEDKSVAADAFPSAEPEEGGEEGRSGSCHDDGSGAGVTAGGGQPRYPSQAIAFLMISTTFQSFAGGGLQAVLELYFSTFLLPRTVPGLSSRRTDKLSTTCMNLWVGLQQVVALSAGYLADKRWGNYKTQIVSNIIAAVGGALLIAATWHLGTNHSYSSGRGAAGGESARGVSSAAYVGNSAWARSRLSSDPGLSHDVAGFNLTAGPATGLNSSYLFHAKAAAPYSPSSSSQALVVDDLGGLPPSNSTVWRNVDMAASFLGLTLVAIGYGQAQTIQSVFVGNQFDVLQKDAKKKSFSWYYLFCNVGSLGGEFGAPVMRQSLQFFVCICAVSGSFIVSAVVFACGHRTYKRTALAQDSPPPTTIAIATGVNNPDLESHPDPRGESTPLLDSNVSDTSQPVSGTGMSMSTGTWRDTFREIRPLLGVFVPLIAFWALFFQQNSTWVLQGQEMNCWLGKLKVPPDAMPSFNDCLVILFIPLLDYIVYPHLKSALGIVATPIRRIGAGMLCTACSFALAGLLQLYISTASEQRGVDDSTDCRGNVSLAWQVPQYIMISFAEVLVAVTGLEFAYSQAPERLRNVVTSLWFISQACGTLLVAVLAEVPIPLRWQYFVYTILMCSLIVVYVFVNRRFRYRQGTAT